MYESLVSLDFILGFELNIQLSSNSQSHRGRNSNNTKYDIGTNDEDIDFLVKINGALRTPI